MMKNKTDFLVTTDEIPRIEVVRDNHVQRFNGSWYRGKSLNFIPTKNQLRQHGAFDKYVLKGYKPKEPFISKESVVTAFGSCFAENISNWLLQNGYNVLGKKLNLNSHIVRFGEGIVNTFAILEQLEWALENKSLVEGLWFGEGKEILPSDEVQQNTNELILNSEV